MALTKAILKEIGLLSDSMTTLYTNPSSTKTYVTQIYLHNIHTSAVVVTIHKVPDNGGSAGTAGDANKVWNVSLSSGETVLLEYEKLGLHMFDQGDTIQAVADIASKVTCEICGFTE